MTEQEVSFNKILEFYEDPEFEKYYPMLCKYLKKIVADKDLQNLYSEFSWYLYWVNDEVVAIAGIRPSKYSYLPLKYNARYLDTLEVATDDKGKGYGTSILHRFTDDGNIWLLYCEEKNYKFYRDNGFHIISPNKEASYAYKGPVSKELKKSMEEGKEF